jgi:hypothetical protein
VPASFLDNKPDDVPSPAGARKAIPRTSEGLRSVDEGRASARLLLVGEQPSDKDVHPSSILRAPDAEARRRERALFVDDLRVAAAALES